jgi:hypothetical protein
VKGYRRNHTFNDTFKFVLRCVSFGLALPAFSFTVSAIRLEPIETSVNVVVKQRIRQQYKVLDPGTGQQGCPDY